VYLADAADKRCYVLFSLAATLFFDDKLNAHLAKAQDHVLKARALNDTHEPEIRSLVAYDLNQLAKERPEFKSQIEAFIIRWLSHQ
jgi:hypothetical protein